MIISASYRTDIPACYGTWLMNRLRAGRCKTTNPYSGRVVEVPLTAPHVDGFVFWTRNLGPFLGRLREVSDRGFPFIVHYSVTGYPRALERSVIPPERAIDHLRQLSREFGPRVGVWRYDPILISSLTPPEYHLGAFERLARSLAGVVDEVVISFVEVYRKTQRNVDMAARRSGFAWWDPPAEQKKTLAGQLLEMARANGMQLSICAQRELLVPGASDARCVDPARLSDVAGHPMIAPARPHRAECGCFESRDIGAYDTCPHGCAFCYAVSDHDRARIRFRLHDPNSEFLIEHPPKARELPVLPASGPTGPVPGPESRGE